MILRRIFLLILKMAPIFIGIESLHSFENNDLRQWLGVFSKKQVKEQHFFWQEFQWRYNADQGRTQQTLFRFGLLKSLSNNHEVGLILGLIDTSSNQEIRPTLQHLYTKSTSEQLNFSLRSRLEYRDLEKNSDQSLRYRLQAGLRYAINSGYSFLLWDEIFLNLTRENWTGDRFTERNRAFIGARIDRDYGRWEMGYLQQYIPRSTQNTTEHIAVVYFYY